LRLNYITIGLKGEVIISDIEVTESAKMYKVTKVKEGEYIPKETIKKTEIDKVINNFVYTFDIEKAKDLLLDYMRKELVAEEKRHKETSERITYTLTQLL
jgi:hypothetical protein